LVGGRECGDGSGHRWGCGNDGGEGSTLGNADNSVMRSCMYSNGGIGGGTGITGLSVDVIIIGFLAEEFDVEDHVASEYDGSGGGVGGEDCETVSRLRLKAIDRSSASIKSAILIPLVFAISDDTTWPVLGEIVPELAPEIEVEAEVEDEEEVEEEVEAEVEVEVEVEVEDEVEERLDAEENGVVDTREEESSYIRLEDIGESVMSKSES